MKVSAAGRILMWRGGSLWIGLAGEPAGFHAHHAVQVTLPFPGGVVRFQRPSEHWTSYSAALVPAHQPHAFEARAQRVAQLFIEPESIEGQQLHLRYGTKEIVSLPTHTLEKEIAAFVSAYEKLAGDAELIALARATISKIAGSITATKILTDARIATAIELIREQIGDAIPLKGIAAAVHLSPDRFRHLFMEETGVRYREYLLWLRLEKSLNAYVAGSTLTEAAYAGGFADSAHLSRTFKRMFGIAPGSVRPERQNTIAVSFN